MRKNLFLYLALACFVGLIAIFVVDGYMGTYDTVYITTGEREEKVGPEDWQQQEKFSFPRQVMVSRSEKAFFRYELDNRRFSSYQANIEVSLWKDQEKISDLTSQPVSISAFDTEEVEWVIDNTELLPKDILPEQGYQYTVIINREGIERKIIININALPYSIKPAAPVPALPPR